MDVSRDNLARLHTRRCEYGNLKEETFLIAAQNNAIRTNYAKAIIDKMQQNSKCMLRGERDETINL